MADKCSLRSFTRIVDRDRPIPRCLGDCDLSSLFCCVVGSVGRLAGDDSRPFRPDLLDEYSERCGHLQESVSGSGAKVRSFAA